MRILKTTVQTNIKVLCRRCHMAEHAADCVHGGPNNVGEKLFTVIVGRFFPTLPEKSVQCCVTSPPYFYLRSYLPDGHPDKHLEIGLEQSPEEYVAEMVAVFREVKRVLRDDGVKSVAEPRG